MKKTCGRIFAAVIMQIVFCVSLSSTVHAQASLSIVDAIPPYKLTPTILSNGHFSISTNYTSPTKGIIYREDGTNNKPINYTSFVHVKIDNDVYQQSYESDTSGFGIPVPHPIVTESIFRDTSSGTPRINARSFAVLPNGDTMRFVFTMFPVKRPSGGFIRLSVAVSNTTSRPHTIGVLLLVDTKIGNNDQAPIATAFGYSTTEKQFDRSVGTGLPEFWLALEGSPIAPGLVARGNLRDVGLVDPDRLLFGNWTDFTSQGIRGLGSALWKERTASNNQYTDSAVLLLWDDEQFVPGMSKIKASTEIGIVDSLSVGFGGGGGGGGGGFGGGGWGMAGAGTCLSVEVNHEAPCGVPGYSPYTPDTLQALYLVSNLDSVKSGTNLNVRVETLPLGIRAASLSSPVIPSNLSAFATGVSVLNLVPVPRLDATSYKVPIALTADPGGAIVLRDTLDVCVPGLRATLEAVDKTYPPVCPNAVDTFDVVFKLKGPRCLPTVSAVLTGAPADLPFFSVVQPIPTTARADSTITIRVRYAPLVNNSTPTIGVLLRLRDFETLAVPDTTFDTPADTAFITCPSRVAEFEFARPMIDTLRFGHICAGDTAIGDWDLRNIGGCALSIDAINCVVISGAAAFTADPLNVLPDVVNRNGTKTINFIFRPTSAGLFRVFAIVHGNSTPTLDTLILEGEADVPLINSLPPLTSFDTLCVGQNGVRRIEIKNTTACPLSIDSVRLSSTTSGWSVQPTNAFTVAPHSSVFVSVNATISALGSSIADLSVHSLGGVQRVQTQATIVTRSVRVVDTLNFGDVFVDSTKSLDAVLVSDGTAPVVVDATTLAGLFPSEYSIALDAGITLPMWLKPGDTLIVHITFKPKDIEQRPALSQLRLNGGIACTTTRNVTLLGRGVQPLVDVRLRSLALGRLCIGTPVDTVISIHNPGNYPLRIDAVSTSGSGAFKVNNVQSVFVQPDSIFRVPVQYVANDIGLMRADVRIQSNGKWITPTDTTIRLSATGIVCGTVRADTIDANVGEPLNAQLHFIPDAGSNSTAANLVRLMNTSGNSGIRLRVQYNDSLVRLHSFNQSTGMVANFPASVLSETRNQVDLATGARALNPDDVVATLQGDVLLSPVYRSILHIEVDSFANGFSRIRTQDGLVRAQYCAFNSRQINTAAVHTMMWTDVRAGVTSVTIVNDAETPLVLRLANVHGEFVETVFEGTITAGQHELQIRGDLPSGLYVISADVGSTQLNQKIIIIH